MKSQIYTTVNISKNYQQLLKKAAQSFGYSQVQYLEKCLYWFKITAMDPGNIEPFSPKIAIEKLTTKMNQAIGFIHKHETEKLKPLLDQIIIANAKLSKTIEYSITRSDVEELHKKLDRLGSHIGIVSEYMKMNGEFEVKNLNAIKAALAETKVQQLKTQEMIEIVFLALSTKGLGNIKQEYIDKFNEKLKL